MRTIDKIITETGLVGGGAPMGRPNVGSMDKLEASGYAGRIYDCAVPMCSCCGAYDKGGAYWGSNYRGDIGQLRVSYTKDLSYINFYRKK